MNEQLTATIPEGSIVYIGGQPGIIQAPYTGRYYILETDGENKAVFPTGELKSFENPLGAPTAIGTAFIVNLSEIAESVDE